MLSSSKNAVPDKPVFRTGLVRVLLVNVAVVPETYVSTLVTASCFIVPPSLTMIWSASAITTLDAEVFPSNTFNSVPVVVIAVEPFNLGDVKVLFVSVSVVARPTSVSVPVGMVTVPELLMLVITGVVSVLFVSVCVPVSVATLLSMASVMLLPLKLEVKPVPPNIPSTSESKSIEPLLLPSVMSKSSAVIAVST